MPPDQTLYRRKFSAVERFALTLNEFVRFNADIIVEGHGTLSTEALQEAINQASQANPASRVRLRGRLGFAAWVDSGIAPEVRRVEAPAWDARSDRGAPFLDEKFDPLSGGPVCRVIHVPGDPSRIVFRTLHAAFDGGAVCYWAAEVFRALRGEKLQGSPCTYTDWDIARKFQRQVNMTGLGDYTGLDIKNKLRNKLQGAPPAECYLPVMPPSARREPGLRYVWRNVIIPAVIPNALAKIAIFLADHARRDTAGPVAFNVPVDLRGRRADVLSLGNLTGTLQVPVKPGDTARVFARHLSRQFDNYADCYRPFLTRLLPWVPLRVLRRMLAGTEPWLYERRPGVVSGGVTSVGTLPLHTMSAPHFNCTEIVAIPAFAGKLNLVLLSTGKHTSITIVTPASYNGDGQLDTLMEALRRGFGA